MPDDKRISELPLATTPLAGTEEQEIVQGGVNKRVAVSEVGGGGGTVTSVTGTASRVAVDNTNPATPVINIDAAYDTAVTNAINAKVADAINDGTTTIAPSQNAVFDALATKLDKLPTLDADKTADYTLALTDWAPIPKTIAMNSATGKNLTVPDNATVAFPVGVRIPVITKGVGVTTVVAGSGSVNIISSSGTFTSPGQNSVMLLWQYSANNWMLFNGSAPLTLTTLSLTPTGFASFTTNEITYAIQGKLLFIFVFLNGTGNATLTTSFSTGLGNFRMTKDYTVRIVNNVTSAVGNVQVAGGTDSVTITATVAGGNFTSSVARYIQWAGVCELA